MGIPEMWDPESETGDMEPMPRTFYLGSLTQKPGPGTLDLPPRTLYVRLYMWEPGPNIFTSNTGPIVRNPYINTTFSQYAIQQRSLVVSNRQLHKSLQHDRSIDYAIESILVYLPFRPFFVHVLNSQTGLDLDNLFVMKEVYAIDFLILS